MRMYRLKFTLNKCLIKFYFLCIIVLTFFDFANAQTPSGFNLVAYEGFNYTAGSSLLNANGGSGWSGSWIKSYQDRYLKTSTTGFSYTGLTTEGLKAEFDNTCYGACNEIASLGRNLTLQSEGVVYIQFISVFGASGTGGTPHIRLFNGTTFNGLIGADTGSFMSIVKVAGGIVQTSSSSSLSSQNFVVVRIDYNLNKTEMWVNPNLSTFNYANPPSSDASATGFAPTFDRIKIFIRSGSIDEIAIFSQITPPTVISGTTAICAGDSTALTASGGTSNSNTLDVWYDGACGGDAFHEGFDTQPGSTVATTINSNVNGILNVTSTTYDPYISMFDLGSFDPTVYKFINFRYRVASGTADLGQIFFLNGKMILADGSKYLDTPLISDNAWHIATLDMSTHPLWATGGNITGIRYDYATNSGVTMDLDFIELSSSPIVGVGSSITVSPEVTRNYYVNRKGPNANTGCISQLVTINPLPIPTFTSQTADIVINTDVSYTTESGQSNYVWTIPGTLNTDYFITSGGTSSDNTLVLKWLTKGSKSVSINYTNTNNCAGTMATSSNSIVVRNNGIQLNGGKISNPALSIDSNGKIGSGKSISMFGELMETPVPPKIGDTYQGGIVFYTSIDASGITHGLIAATSDMAKATWANRLTAAAAYTGGGYSDWRLPNTTELGYLYAKRNISGLAGTFQTSSAAYFYWASNNRTGDYGNGYSFNSGSVVSGGKVYNQSIRPIRSF